MCEHKKSPSRRTKWRFPKTSPMANSPGPLSNVSPRPAPYQDGVGTKLTNEVPPNARARKRLRVCATTRALAIGTRMRKIKNFFFICVKLFFRKVCSFLKVKHMKIKNILQRILSTTFFGIASTNFCNAVYAYNSGPYGQRKGFLDSNTNSFVVWSNATFGVAASAFLTFLAFKK